MRSVSQSVAALGISRVLLLDHYDLMGGAQACLLDQAAGLLRRGHIVSSCIARDPIVQARLDEVPGLQLIPVFPFLTKRPLSTSWPADVLHLRHLAKPYDNLLANSVSGLITGALARRRGQRLLFQCHRVDLGPIQRSIVRFAAPDLILSVSDSSQDYLLGLGLPVEQVRLVGNGFDLSAFPALPLLGADPDRPLRIGLVARLHREKGVEEFIALARSLTENRRLQFVLIGPLVDPPLAPMLEQATRAGWVEVQAYVGHPQDIYRNLDVVVSISRFLESFGRTVVEAALFGRPAIVLRRGHTPRLIDDGRTGWVVKDLREIEHRLSELADQRHLLIQAGMAAREAARGNHDLELILDRLEACLNNKP
jgi:glycosyltransferase involved in cell wall biosynthesis